MYTDNPRLVEQVNECMKAIMIAESFKLNIVNVVDKEFDKATTPVDYYKLTALAITLLLKRAEFADIDEEKVKMYSRLFGIVDDYTKDTLVGEELNFYTQNLH